MSQPDKPSKKPTRRQFIRSAAVTGVSLAAAPAFLRAQDAAAPAPQSTESQKLRLAFIGTGGIGGYHLDSTKDMGIVCPCYCDVDTNEYKKAAELHPNAKTYQDYREMFDKEHKNFDAIMIGIPDHQHYPATVLAMQHGKHVYTQKPLTHTPWEARQLLKAAKKYKVVTQMGNQGHAKEGWRLVYEWIHSGALGDITEVHTWTDRPIWPQGVPTPEGEDTPPSTLNWDVWIGPAPMRAYKKDAYHRFAWRGWWDFGCGALGDMACHTMDGMFWALNPGHCTSVEPLAMTPMDNDSFPKASVIRWIFPASGDRKAFAAYWYDGGLRPQIPALLESGRKLGGTGNLFLGTKASIIVQGDYGDSPRVFPADKMKEIGKPPQLLERSPGHIDEWVMACKGEKPIDFPKSNFAYAAPFSETILLGNIAMRVGRRLEWDGENMKFTNVDEANQFVTKEYRSGWDFKV